MNSANTGDIKWDSRTKLLTDFYPSYLKEIVIVSMRD